MVGTKKKNGKDVPNCVPKDSVDENAFAAKRNEGGEVEMTKAKFAKVNKDYKQTDKTGSYVLQSDGGKGTKLFPVKFVAESTTVTEFREFLKTSADYLKESDGYFGEIIDEAIVKKVNSDGSISKVLDKKTRSRKATQTTGMSKSKRRLIAKKAAKTKKKDLSGQNKANRKRKKTLKKRKNLGL
jgi:hypothetical protein